MTHPSLEDLKMTHPSLERVENDDNSTSGMAIPICAWFVFWQEQMDGTYDPTSVLL